MSLKTCGVVSSSEPILRADGSPVSHGAYRTFFDNDELAEEDDVFVDLIDNPKTTPLLAMVCGNGGLDEGENQYNGSYGTVRFWGMSGRIVPMEGNGEGYTVCTPITSLLSGFPARESHEFCCDPLLQGTATCRPRATSGPAHSSATSSPSPTSGHPTSTAARAR